MQEKHYLQHYGPEKTSIEEMWFSAVQENITGDKLSSMSTFSLVQHKRRWATNEPLLSESRGTHAHVAAQGTREQWKYQTHVHEHIQMLA